MRKKQPSPLGSSLNRPISPKVENQSSLRKSLDAVGSSNKMHHPMPSHRGAISLMMSSRKSPSSMYDHSSSAALAIRNQHRMRGDPIRLVDKDLLSQSADFDESDNEVQSIFNLVRDSPSAKMSLMEIINSQKNEHEQLATERSKLLFTPSNEPSGTTFLKEDSPSLRSGTTLGDTVSSLRTNTTYPQLQPLVEPEKMSDDDLAILINSLALELAKRGKRLVDGGPMGSMSLSLVAASPPLLPAIEQAACSRPHAPHGLQRRNSPLTSKPSSSSRPSSASKGQTGSKASSPHLTNAPMSLGVSSTNQGIVKRRGRSNSGDGYFRLRQKPTLKAQQPKPLRRGSAQIPVLSAVRKQTGYVQSRTAGFNSTAFVEDSEVRSVFPGPASPHMFSAAPGTSPDRSGATQPSDRMFVSVGEMSREIQVPQYVPMSHASSVSAVSSLSSLASLHQAMALHSPSPPIIEPAAFLSPHLHAKKHRPTPLLATSIVEEMEQQRLADGINRYDNSSGAVNRTGKLSSASEIGGMFGLGLVVSQGTAFDDVSLGSYHSTSSASNNNNLMHLAPRVNRARHQPQPQSPPPLSFVSLSDSVDSVAVAEPVRDLTNDDVPVVLASLIDDNAGSSTADPSSVSVAEAISNEGGVAVGENACPATTTAQS